MGGSGSGVGGSSVDTMGKRYEEGEHVKKRKTRNMVGQFEGKMYLCHGGGLSEKGVYMVLLGLNSCI